MQEYKMLVRAVWGGETQYLSGGVILIQNAMEAQDYLNEVYLQKGYRVLSVDYLGEFITDPDNPKTSPQGPRFAWHLVKDVETSSSKKANDK